jgi:hypothetical protein
MSGLFVVVFFLIVAISKYLKNASRDIPTGTPPPSGIARPPTSSEEERLRRFREALGLPPTGAVPPPVRPRPQTMSAPLRPVNPPAAIGRAQRVPPMTSAPPLQTQPRTLKSSPSAPQPLRKAAAPLVPVAPAAPVQQAPPVTRPANTLQPLVEPAATTVKPTIIASGLMARLRDPVAIREAIILREILGPPKALQPAWAPPSSILAPRG